MIPRRAALALGCLTLTGCFFFRAPYIDSQLPDAATLTFVPSLEPGPGVYLVGFPGTKDCSGEVNLTGKPTLTNEVTIKVPPGEEFPFLAMTQPNPWGQCNIVVAFTPRPREAYRATVHGTASTCEVRITNVVDGREVAERSARKRTFKRPITASGAHCK